MRYSLIIIAIFSLLATAPAFGQEFMLEKTNDRIFVLEECDHVHAIDGNSKCTKFHVEPIKKVTGPGSKILLNGAPYVVEWMGAGYYTVSGKVLQARGSNDASEIQLVEVRPGYGRNHQSRWQDIDHDGQLSIGDKVTVDGRSELIVDKRLNVQVSAVH